MKHRLLPLLRVLLAGFAAGVWLFGRGGSTGISGPKAQLLEVERVSPEASIGDPVPAALGEVVEFVYVLRNTGPKKVTGLHIAPSCGWRVTEEPDDDLPPGAATRVGLVMKPMSLGVTARGVAVRAAGYTAPVALVRPALSVPVAAPQLLGGPQSAILTHVRGGDLVGPILQFETIERVDSRPWLSGLEASPAGLVAMTAEPMSQRAYPDGQFCLRSYRFHVAAGLLPLGKHEAVVEPVVSAPPRIPRVRLQLRVLERLAFAPERVVFPTTSAQDDEPPRVVVMDNVGAGTIDVVDFDQELLDVRRVGPASPGSATFELGVKALSNVATETTVIFVVDGAYARELQVNIAPASSRACF